MPEQSDAELIAEARELLPVETINYSPEHDYIAHLAERLEAADQRGEEAEREHQGAHGAYDLLREKNRQTIQQRDALAAVVEKARELAENTLHPDQGKGRCGVCKLEALLATAPADALREHDAELIEAYQSQIRSTIGAFGDADGVWAFDSAVKTIEEARQRREARS